MVNLLIGAIAMIGFIYVLNYARKNSINVSWWQWALTVLGFLYSVLVLEVIYSFLSEGAAQAALVIGLSMAVVAIIWGVLLKRFIFVNVK
jgi:hypothetical protein